MNIEKGSEVKEIQLSNNKVAIVDDGDYENLSRYTWSAERKRQIWYASCQMSSGKVYMHRFIMDANQSELVDHKDRDGLNNQRNNLRKCTDAQNSQNRKKSTANKSGYKGVYWHKKARKYAAKIENNGIRRYLGLFEDAVSAAKAYDRAAVEYHGEYAHLNFPI